MTNNHNTLPRSGAFKISNITQESDKIGAVVCPKCSHSFVKLVETGISSNAPVNYQAEAIQAVATIATGYLMYKVTTGLLILSSSFSTIQTSIQTLLLIITIALLWLALPILQYMRLYSTWLWCIYALGAVFVPLEITILSFQYLGGAS